MDIIPPNVQDLFVLYQEELADLYSRRFYERYLSDLKDNWLVIIAGLVDFGPLEQACAEYHHQEGKGDKPDYSVALLTRALLLRYLNRWSYMQTEYELRTSPLAKWFVGLSLTAEVPDHSTLCRFEQWVKRNRRRKFFDESVRQVMDAYPEEHSQPRIMDTFAMRGNVTPQTLIQKLRHLSHMARKLLKVGYPQAYQKFQAELEAHPQARQMLYFPKGSTPECFLDKQAYQERVQWVVLGVLEFEPWLRSLLPNCPSVDLLHDINLCLESLEHVLKTEVKIETDKTGGLKRIRELPADKKGSPLIVSGADLHIRFRYHAGGKDVQPADNVGVRITSGGVIDDIEAFVGNEADQEVFPTMTQHAIERGEPPPEKLVMDRAGGSGKTRARIAKITGGKTQVYAHTMPYGKHAERFTPDEFSLSEDGTILTCPHGKSTANFYAHGKGDGRQFRFHSDLCQGCPFNPHENPTCLDPQADPPAQLPASGRRICRDPESKPDSFRQVFISDYRHIVAEANEFNKSDGFKQTIKLRPRVERVVFELTHYCGARRARSTGLESADFQAKMAATAYNLKLWARRVLSERQAARAKPAQD